MPLSSARPAAAASAVSGCAPMPAMTMSTGSSVPSVSRAASIRPSPSSVSRPTPSRMSTPWSRCSARNQSAVGFAGDAGEQADVEFHQHDVEADAARDRRRLQPDVAAADDEHPLARRHRGLQPVDVGEAADDVAAGQPAGAGAGQGVRSGAGGEDRGVETVRAAGVGEGTGGGLECGDLGSEVQLDGVVVVERARAQVQPVPSHLAQQIGLGERRALVGQRVLGSPEGEAAGVSALAQRLHQRGPGLPGPDDGDVVHVVPAGGTLPGQL